MLIGILSDSHEHLTHIALAKRLLQEREVSMAIHLGDYCAGPSVRALEGLNIIGIAGNNDGDLLRILGNFKKIGGDFRGHFCTLEYDGLSIACYHGTEQPITDALIDCGSYDVVLTGHTHQARFITRGNVLAINPGSVHGFEFGPTVAVLDTVTRNVDILSLLDEKQV